MVWVMGLRMDQGTGEWGRLGGPCPVSSLPADWFLWSGLRGLAGKSLAGQTIGKLLTVVSSIFELSKPAVC